MFTRNLKKQRLTHNKICLKHGSIGIRALEDFKLTFNEIESVRKVISFNYKKIKIWFNVEFNLPVRSKSSESRMGKGIGKLKNWVFNVKKGSIILELDNVPNYLISKIFKLICPRFQTRVALVLKKKSL